MEINITINKEDLKAYKAKLDEINVIRVDLNRKRMLELANMGEAGQIPPIFQIVAQPPYPELRFSFDGFLEWLAGGDAVLDQYIPKETNHVDSLEDEG